MSCTDQVSVSQAASTKNDDTTNPDSSESGTSAKCRDPPQNLEVPEDAYGSKRMRHSISQIVASSATLRQPSQHGFERLSLLGLPGEIRSHIYSYLIPKRPVRIQQMEYFRSRKKEFGFPGPTEVCQLIRTEYISLLLSRVKVEVFLISVGAFAQDFGATLQYCQLNVVVFCDTIGQEENIDILPLLVLVMEAPGLTINLDLTYPSSRNHNAFSDPELQELCRLLGLSRTNSSWRQYLRSAAFETLVAHYPCGRYDQVTNESPHDAWLQLTLVKDYRKTWMDGTHSFDDLEEFLADTGLDGLTAMDVRVGLTSMKNKGRGKGLRTQDEQKTMDWLLNRSKRTPDGVKARPRMLKELEDDFGWQA